MPWKALAVSELRVAACHAVRTCGRQPSQVAREFGVSRKTLYKWLGRFDRGERDLQDHTRRPQHAPARTGHELEQRALAVRDHHGWGPRKIHAVLRREQAADAPASAPLPCMRTIARILRRHGRVTDAAAERDEPAAMQRFERPVPNDLWQVDHKGPVEVARRKLVPFTILDDHSRYCLRFEPLVDRTMRRCWAVLWDAFGEVGLPRQILCDNAFGTMGIDRPVGLSWFDAQCVKLGIDPIHGHPYHPQTQGKVEALHASAVRELIYRHARRDHIGHFCQDCQAWRRVYNVERPHEALDDEVPLSRWRPSPRPRPAVMPAAMVYEPGQTLRRVCLEGLVRWRGCRILVGRGIGGDWVRIEEEEQELRVFYGLKQVRRLRPEQMIKDRVV